MTYEQNTQWLEASKHDVTQWAAVMERDADERIIDWDWVCSLDFVAGVGAGARLDLVHDEYDAHALLMQDYAIRERLEAILENVTSVFMGDFDRNLDSFRLARALAYANRRLNDEITLIMEQGKVRRLWNVERRFERGTAFVVLHGNEDAHANEIVNRSAQLAQERAQRRNHAMNQRKAGSQMMQQASLSSFTDDKVLSEESGQTSRPAAPRRSDSQYDWRMAYLPGRDVDAVLGIDIETTGTSAWRDYIIDVGFERMNLQTPAPEGAKARDVYSETDYAADGAYDQSRLSFGVPLRCAEVANPFIAQLTGIDVTKIAGEPIFDEWPRMQQALLERLMQQPYVAHNATFEHRFFMANVEGYAEAYRNGEITILDTMPMSRHWDAGSVPSPGHPHGDNTLEAYAKRQGALDGNSHERHLGLEDAHIMLVAMRHHLGTLKVAGEGPSVRQAVEAWEASTPDGAAEPRRPAAPMPMRHHSSSARSSLASGKCSTYSTASSTMSSAMSICS